MSEKMSDSIGFAAVRHSQKMSPSSVICAIGVLDPGYGGPRMRKSDRSRGRSGDSQFKAYNAGMLQRSHRHCMQDWRQIRAGELSIEQGGCALSGRRVDV